MDRMKTFLRYLIIFVAFYLLTNVLTSVALSNNYKQIACEKNETASYTVSVAEAKATSVSGYVSGTVKLNKEVAEPEKYMQIDFYSKYGTCLGRKYIELGSVKSGEKEFKVNFDYNDVSKFEITSTNDIENLSEVQSNMVSKGYMAMTVLGVLIILYYVL